MTNIVLSVLVVVHNEEGQLADCLEALGFADELVVVLDKCTDGSKAIAEKCNARLVEGAWEIEGHRRNTGLDACRGNWILEVDADERANEALGQEITIAIEGLAEQPADGYFLLPFDNYIGTRLVRYGWGGSWGVSAAPRL
ncbi:MAG: glycosyltransferase, partial [Rhodospirillaceae bacterium]|nr:glycosyltransferase [Rhodospirillaceae bacterium]